MTHEDVVLLCDTIKLVGGVITWAILLCGPIARIFTNNCWSLTPGRNTTSDQPTKVDIPKL